MKRQRSLFGDAPGKPAKRSGRPSKAQLDRMCGVDGQVDLFVDELRDAKVKDAARGKAREYEARKAVVRRRARDPDAYTSEKKRVAKSIEY